MIADAFLNGWVVALSAVALPMSLWTADDVKEVVLDTFGFLFLYNLDDYDNDLSIGVQGDDFDDLMEHLLEGLVAMQKRDGTTFAAHHWSSQFALLVDRFKNGGLIFSIARLLNFLTAAFALPAFLILVWVPPPPDAHTDVHAVLMSLKKILANGYVVRCGLLMMFVVILVRSWAVRNRHEGRAKHAADGEFDYTPPTGIVFFLQVILPMPMENRWKRPPPPDAEEEQEEDGDVN